jgi:hypothetical protein
MVRFERRRCQLIFEEQVGKDLLHMLPAFRRNGLFEDFRQVIKSGVPIYRNFSTVVNSLEGEKTYLSFDVQIARLGDGVIAS